MPIPLPTLPGMILRAAATALRPAHGAILQPSLAASFSVTPPHWKHLQAYKKALGDFQSAIPLTYLYLLAQRAQLALMLRREFPYAVPGLVHVANTLQRLRPLTWDAEWRLDIALDPVPAQRTGPNTLSFAVDIRQAGRQVAACVSTYAVRSGKASAGRPIAQAAAPDYASWNGIDLWQLPADAGYRYAKLSGDFNPIHLHPWLARVFGFRAAIMHGMYSIGRASAAIEAAAGAQVSSLSALFKQPVYLPASVALRTQPEDAGAGSFVLISPDLKSAHVTGRYQLG